MSLNYVLDFEIFYGVIIFIFMFVINREKNKNNTLIDNFIISTYYIYLISVVSLVFFPIPLYLIVDKAPDAITFDNFINLNVLNITKLFKDNPIQILGNFLLLVPLGVYYPLVKGSREFKRILFIGFLTTFSIEVIQLVLALIIGWPFRYFDVCDIFLNTFGIIFGYLLSVVSLSFIAKNFELDSNILIRYKKYVLG